VSAIKKGTLVVSEAPILTIPPIPHFSVQGILSQLKQLDPAKRASFFSLTNAYPHLQPIEGILKTNGLPLDQGYGPTNGIFLDYCRFNHSCTPNAAYQWHANIARETVHAIKDIEAGEEITVCYVLEDHLYLPRRVRRAYLAQAFGFDCLCIRCADDDPHEQESSDRRRIRLAASKREADDGYNIHENPGRALRHCQEALHLAIAEGESYPTFETLFLAAFQISSITTTSHAPASLPNRRWRRNGIGKAKMLLASRSWSGWSGVRRLTNTLARCRHGSLRRSVPFGLPIGLRTNGCGGEQARVLKTTW
jgi:hypothetical protein